MSLIFAVFVYFAASVIAEFFSVIGSIQMGQSGSSSDFSSLCSRSSGAFFSVRLHDLLL